MKNGFIDVVFILDKSGSMYSMQEDAIGGYNSLIEETKKLEEDILVTTVLFNNDVTFIEERTRIEDVSIMDEEKYRTGGSTALLDAIGLTIDHLDDEKEKSQKVLFYITTDGMENSSHEYSYKMIKKMIEHKQKENWTFNFLASEIDEKEVGFNLGIKAERIHKVKASKEGQRMMYCEMCRSVEEDVLSK
jgi:Mg-chelatase subunit ChlD